MISLEIACKNAETMMLRYGYVKGFLDIRETDTKWFFVGSLSEDGPTPFAAVPFFVKKENGECGMVLKSEINAMCECCNAPKVEIPSEFQYKIKSH